MQNYANEYTYHNAHMASMVNDMNGTVPPLDFQFDGAGNMVLQSVPDPNLGKHERYLCWDEENRLSATRDQYYATANIYDASGNRAWKLGGELNWMWNNGQGWQAYGDLNLRTWYQSDLVTITDQAMTKHYFIAGQRIASKLAESFAPEVVQNIKGRPIAPLSGEVTKLGTIMTERLRRDFECLGIDYNAFYPGEVKLEALETLLNAPEQPAEYQVFFYHSDHLGSSSFITDVNGDATQHLQYLPFGEDLVHEQNTAAYLSPYTFSGKERDVETSLSYFGARYYEAGLSVWLSVDPMADRLHSITPYNYTLNNPVVLNDPDGRFPWGFVIGAGAELAAQIAVNKLTGKKWYELDLADIAVSGAAGMLTGGFSSLTKIGKVKHARVAVAAVMASAAVDVGYDAESDRITMSSIVLPDGEQNWNGLVIEVSGKALTDVGVETAFGFLGVKTKKLLNGAFNSDIQKQADKLLTNAFGPRNPSTNALKKELGQVADQHDMVAEGLTNWSYKYTLEETKQLGGTSDF